jgi:predicted alpha/beta superfamily hydrolase
MNHAEPAAPTRTRRARAPADPGHLFPLGPFDIPGVGERGVRVFLPPGYSRGRGDHPVLFMWDGQNVFGDEGSFAGGWHAHETVRKRARARRVAPVVVGINHGNAMRMKEMVPWMAHSAAEPMLDWLVNTLVPLMYREFRLKPGPGGMTIGGSSLGGLMALYSHLRRPDVFSGALCMSPSLFVGRGAMFEFARSNSKPWQTRVYLDAGGYEAGGRMVTLAQRMASELKAHGWQDKKELMLRVVKTHGHNERAWRRRLPRALKFLYG